MPDEKRFVPPGFVECGVCGRIHLRRPGKANETNPLCHKCAEKFGTIPSGDDMSFERINLKMKTNW